MSSLKVDSHDTSGLGVSVDPHDLDGGEVAVRRLLVVARANRDDVRTRSTVTAKRFYDWCAYEGTDRRSTVFAN